MITIDLALALTSINPQINHFIEDVAYDAEGNEVAYDIAAGQAKLAELQAEKTAIEATKESALTKLKKLGLTADEIAALTGN